MKSNINDYKGKLDRIISGKFKIKELLRLNVKINNKIIPDICLNEIFIGDSKPYNMFNYKITIKNKTEFQRSSGILVGTPAGSYAWLKSANGKILKINSKKYQYLCRELYSRNLTKNYKLKKGILKESEKVKIEVKSPGILIIDSVSSEYNLDRQDIIEIVPSKNYLEIVDF